MDKTFIFFDHQGKGNALVSSLERDGWKRVMKDQSAEIVLADCDVPEPRTSQLKKLHERGSKIFIYPHAARPPVYYDLFPENSWITAQFVTTSGHIEVLRKIGYKGELQAVGWMLCPQRPFRQVEKVDSILFAPIHANGNKWMSEEDKKINHFGFHRTARLAERWECKLTVRHVDPLDKIGVPRVDGITYVSGKKDQSYKEIDEADLVIGTQTIQYLSVARGIPTVGLGEDTCPKVGWDSVGLEYVKNWGMYKDDIKFPLDILAEGPPHYEAVEALVGSRRIFDWRSRMVGANFDSATFLQALYSYL